MARRIINQPRTQVLNGVTFTDDEVSNLAGWFHEGIPAVLDKADIVASSEIQKGLKAAAVYSVDINSGDTADLYLTEDGYQLTEITDEGVVAPPIAGVTFTSDQILALRAFFPVLDMLTMTAVDIRASTLLVSAVQGQYLQAGAGTDSTVILRLTQKGRALLGAR